MGDLQIQVIISIVIGLATAIGVIIALIKIWMEKKQENNRRFSELIIHSAREMNRTLQNSIDEQDDDTLIHKTIAYLDELDTLVVLANKEKIDQGVTLYFSHDIGLANIMLQWLDDNKKVSGHEKYYSKRWQDIGYWVETYEDKKPEEDVVYPIPINHYDLPKRMRPWFALKVRFDKNEITEEEFVKLKKEAEKEEAERRADNEKK